MMQRLQSIQYSYKSSRWELAVAFKSIVKDRIHVKHRLKHASPQDYFDYMPRDSKVDRAMSEIG